MSSSAIRHFRPTCESLETREMPAALAVGMNLEHVVDYNPQWMFTDAFKSSRTWTSQSYNTITRALTGANGGDVHVDTLGWPTQLNQWTNDRGQLMQQQLETRMFDGIDGHYPAGTYQTEWQGSGMIVFGGDAVATSQGTTSDGKHYASLSVTPSRAGISLRITSDNPSDPIRNIHVWMPDHKGQSFAGQVWHPGASFSPFHPLFLERLSPFKTIRYMQPMDVIPSQIVHWSDRKSVDSARQSTFAADFQNGLAPEYAIELSNELHSDPWFCMPHLADDDYIRSFATLVRDTLSKDRKVYVEWSDEPWNPSPGYQAHAWLVGQAQLPQNAGMTIYQIWAREMKRDFDIWTDVFAGQTNRLVRVVAGQAASSWIVSQLLPNMDGHFDAVSCDAYVTFARPQLQALPPNITPDQVIDRLLSDSLPNTLTFLRNHRALADQYSLSLHRPIQLLAYEGGPLLAGSGTPFEQVFLDAGHNPRMYDVYKALLQGANQVGMDLFLAYVYTDTSPFGDASILRWQDQPLADAAKYRALLDAISGAFYTFGNSAPRSLSISGPPGGYRGQTLAFSGSYIDPDVGDQHTLSWQVLDANNGIVATGTGDTFRFTPATVGTFTLRFTVADDHGGVSSTSRTLTVIAPYTGASRTMPTSTRLATLPRPAGASSDLALELIFASLGKDGLLGTTGGH